MALLDAINKLLALVDYYLAILDRPQPPFDFEQFTELDRAVYVEAVHLGLVHHLPKPGRAKEHSGRTNMPSGPGTMWDPPGYFYPMPSCIPAWRDELLTLRELAVKEKPPRASDADRVEAEQAEGAGADSDQTEAEQAEATNTN